MFSFYLCTQTCKRNCLLTWQNSDDDVIVKLLVIIRFFRLSPTHQKESFVWGKAAIHWLCPPWLHGRKNIRSYINFLPQDQRSWKNRILNSIWELLFLTPTSPPPCALKWGVGTLGVGTFHCKVQTPNTCNVFPLHLLQLVSTSAHPFLCCPFNFWQRETGLFAQR